MEANRLTVAWYREHDPNYLATFKDDLSSILKVLPNPVPTSQDERTYFTANYEKLGSDPQAYGWFQLKLVLRAYDEPPVTFQQALKALQGEMNGPSALAEMRPIHRFNGQLGN